MPSVRVQKRSPPGYLRVGEAIAGAQAIIEQLDSYTEVSPSGEGVHILATGELPPGRRRTTGLELYDKDRYFTVTGQHLAGTPLTVAPRSAELHALHVRLFGNQKPTSAVRRLVESEGSSKTHASAALSDEALVARMTAAGNGQRFALLWRGEWSGSYRSQSEADLALCSTLAFWTRPGRRTDGPAVPPVRAVSDQVGRATRGRDLR